MLISIIILKYGEMGSMNQEIRKQIQEYIKIEDNIVALYDYGSIVYQTNNKDSDHDVILILKNKEDSKTIDFLNQWLDVNVFSEEEFKHMIKEHEISALECLFLNKENIWKENQSWHFELHLPTLRNAVSAKSSNSWVKAKKKFIVEKDFNDYIGKKSAWHAIRMLNFGTQIAKCEKIVDFKSMNDLLPQIMECHDWEEIDSKFRKTYNETSSAFKLVAPKEVNYNKPKMK